MFKPKVLKVLLVLNYFSLNSCSLDITQNSSFDGISVENLRQYTAIVHCLAKINDEFSSCNQKANETGRQILADYKLDSINGLPNDIRCCGLIALSKCWINAAKHKCNHNETVLMNKLPFIVIPYLRNECQNYIFYPHKCSTNAFNLWQIITFLLIIPVIAFAIVTAIVFINRKRKYSYSRGINF